MKKKLLLALIPLTVLMFFSSGVVYAVDKADEITFADPLVETAVREAIGKDNGTIHADDIEDITSLRIYGNPYAWEEEIIDLSGLENLLNLKGLTINDVGVTDFSPLSGLADFKSISFKYCKINSLDSLSILPHLENLSLTACDVSLVNLGNLTGLQQLSITDIRISDVSQLSFPSGLWSLHLQNNDISDIPQLSNLTNLMDLDIVENHVSDITPLLDLHVLDRLTSLTLTENCIRDIASLANLDGLQALKLSGNHISDIDSLSRLDNLSYLWLEDNDIMDISPVLEIDLSGNGGYTRLTADSSVCYFSMKLYIKDNPLSDASIEKCIPQLKEMEVMVDY